jgi:hypothetical protein
MPILTDNDAGWADACRAWNLAVDQRPAAVAVAESATEVTTAVRYAAERGLRVAAQGTGHAARPLGSLDGTLLLRTHAMRQVTVEPQARTAWVEAGAQWQDVVDEAGKYGLAALAGSAPSVGVTGYTLGGGMSLLGREFGLSANNVEAFEAVTADGQLVRADRYSEPDLFWALRGGGGSFAVVTGLELRLFPVREVYAGLLWWPAAAAGRVLPAWRELTQGEVPDEFTTRARFVTFPSVSDVPAELRGRSFLIIDGIHIGDPAEADEILAPLRALAPVTDTMAMMPAAALSQLHLGPAGPVPVSSDGFLLGSLPAQAVDDLVAVVASGAGALSMIELRQLGGELSRTRPSHGALDAIEAPYLLLPVGSVPDQAAAAAVEASCAAVRSALAGWTAEQTNLNVCDVPADPATFWSPAVYQRLRAIKAAVDPDDLIRSNRPVPPAARF